MNHQIIDDGATDELKEFLKLATMKRIEVTGQSKKHYMDFCSNVRGEGFWSQGTFRGIPYAEETSEPNKWKVIFKNPIDESFFTDTYSWTNVPPNSDYFYN